MLEVNVSVMRGELTITASFKADTGVTALFGHSGAGKTTILNMIAGVVKPRTGKITLNGTTLFDAQRINVPPEHRRIGYVFQDRRLFPHLSVHSNLLYGFNLLAQNLRAQQPDDVIALLDLAPLLARKPANLSGGEQQRVAIGRALLTSPQLLLMDEPLASLDSARKGEILPYLERLRDTIRLPIIYVSHDEREVQRLAAVTIPVVDGVAGPLGP
ncbi:MAG: molybdenum ABC transporter ATP-binding protein [Rhodospirillaceae bacterium]|nr:molybdenum ABC transporter ATP-binding protein [Rhodospirillaceae bacterium]